MSDKQNDVVFRFRGMDRVSNVARGIGKSLGGLSRSLGPSMARFSRAAGGMSRSLSALGAPIGLISGGAVVAGLAKSLTLFASLGDEAAKTSRALNMSTAAYRELGYWAERNGLSTEQWATAQRALSSRLARAAGGENKALAEMLSGLNIELRDAQGNARKTDDVLLDLAQAFEANTDPIMRQRMAVALYGEELGIRMVDAMSQGKEAMIDLRKEAVRLGMSLTDEQGRAAEKLTDQMTNLSRSLQGMAITIGIGLAPVLGPLIDQMTEWVVANRDLIASGVAEYAEKISNALFPAAVHANEFAGAMGDVQQVAALGGLGVFMANIKDVITGIGDVIEFFGGWESAAIALAVVMNGSLIASTVNLGIAMGQMASVALAPALAGMTAGLGGFITALRAGYPVMTAFNLALAANPIGVVLVSIAALAGAAYLVYRNWEPIAGFFKERWESIKAVFTESIAAIKATVSGITDFIGGVFSGDLDRVFAGLGGIVDGFVGQWSANFKFLMSPVEGLLALVDRVFGTDLAAGFGKGLDAITGFAAEWRNIFSGLEDWIPSLPEWMGGEPDTAQPATTGSRPPPPMGAEMLRRARDVGAGPSGGGSQAAPVSVRTEIVGQVQSVKTVTDNGHERRHDSNMYAAIALAGG